MVVGSSPTVGVLPWHGNFPLFEGAEIIRQQWSCGRLAAASAADERTLTAHAFGIAGTTELQLGP